MRKRFYAGALVLVAAGSAIILALRLYPEPGKYAPLTAEELRRARLNMGQDLPTEPLKSAPLPEKKIVRLAIGSLGLADENRNRQLADLVTTGLSDTQGVELVDRQSMDKVLAELQLSFSGLVRAKDAIKAGKLLRADWFLLGTSTTLAGTNSIVLRVVDARTGIFRDAAVFPAREAPVGLASQIAEFLRQSRKNASSGNRPVYLAIGTFEDFSINSRQAGFPTQLRGYLNAAFQNGPVTLLEREYVETLLNEVHLDMAGLTEEAASAPSTPMQSAFWVVSGNYQSYETTNLQIEVDLTVARMFGATKHARLVDLPGDRLNYQVKAAIDEIIRQGGEAIFPTRRNEVRFAMEQGEQLSGVDRDYANPDLVYLGRASIVTDEQTALRKRRNVEEALRAFETVLLLEPTNQEARLYMAACFRNETIGRFEEARQLYREVIERPLNDKWSEIAKKALSASFDSRDMKARALWFEAAAAQTSSPTAAEFYRRETETAKTEYTLKGTGADAQALAETRLLANITNSLLGGNVAGPLGIDEFVQTFGTNRVDAARRLAELYPKLRSQAPEFGPYLLAAVVSAQVDTNSEFVVQLHQLLGQFKQHPGDVVSPRDFWRQLQLAILEWSWTHKDYGLAASLLEAKAAASASTTNRVQSIDMTDQDRLSLAFAYLGTHEWDKALPIFQSFFGQPFSMSMDGPWGGHGTVLLTDQLADFCRKKLGEAVTPKPSEFALGKPVLQLCPDQRFTMDEAGFWTVRDDYLLHLDFELKTNLVLKLPIRNGAPATAICISPTNVWVGTDGDGLIDCDKTTGHCRHLSESDGLLMDKIASLYLTQNELWIGYGRRARRAEPASDGGLGNLDLRTSTITSFTPSLAKDPQLNKWDPGVTGGPTRSSVLVISQGLPGEIWFLGEAQLCQYRSSEKTWAVVNHGCTSLARGPKYLYVGRYWNHFGEERTGPFGVSVLDLSSTNSSWRDVQRPDGLPPGRVTALATEGRNLWVGGFGYIASIDPESDKLRAFVHVQAETINCLQTGGGFLWAQFNCCLYRVPLSTLP